MFSMIPVDVVTLFWFIREKTIGINFYFLCTREKYGKIVGKILAKAFLTSMSGSLLKFCMIYKRI